MIETTNLKFIIIISLIKYNWLWIYVGNLMILHFFDLLNLLVLCLNSGVLLLSALNSHYLHRWPVMYYWGQTSADSIIFRVFCETLTNDCRYIFIFLDFEVLSGRCWPKEWNDTQALPLISSNFDFIFSTLHIWYHWSITPSKLPFSHFQKINSS